MCIFYIYGMSRIVLRVDLDGELVNELAAVKKHLGLKNNTETIRFLIHEKYMEMRKRKSREE